MKKTGSYGENQRMNHQFAGHAAARRARCRLHAALFFAMTVGQAAHPALAATSVSIWPIDPVIDSGRHAAALWLENRDTKPVTLQVRVLGWHDENGREVYDDRQRRVVGSPPMAVVPPAKRQLIRLTKLVDAAPGTEGAYRVLIDEVPRSVGGASAAAGGASFGIQFEMHYSIPLFVDGAGVWTKENPEHPRDPATAAQPVLGWHVERDGATRWLVIGNRGAVHARLTEIAFDANGQRTDVERGLLGYVLPGARMRWALRKNWPPGNGTQPKLIATVNGRAGVVIDPDAGAERHR